MEAIAPTGYLDMHSHLLPGIDDGCESADDALACIRHLQQHGFVGSVCTPHILRHLFPDNTPENIGRFVAELNQRLQTAQIDYTLWPGGEVRINEDALRWVKTIGIPTLGSSRYVLLDYFGMDWPTAGDALIDYLLAHDYRPILAHPERMDLPDDEWDELLDRLCDKGVLLQGNLNSIIGGEGELAQARMRQLCGEDRYFLFASDTHRSYWMDTRMQGLRMLESEFGRTRIERLLCEHPNKILNASRCSPQSV